MAAHELNRGVRQLQRIERLAPVDAIEALDSLTDHVAACRSPDQLARVAAAMPQHVAGLCPEVCLELSALAAKLPHPVVPKDVYRLEPLLRTQWSRIRIAVEDTCAPQEWSESELLRCVTGWSVGAIARPAAVLRRLADAQDVRLRACALRWLRQAVGYLGIVAEEAFACLAVLADDDNVAIRSDAVGMFAECWLAGLSPGSERRRIAQLGDALRSDDIAVVDAAARASARLGARDLLSGVVADAARVVHAPAAVKYLGAVATDDDVDAVLLLAHEEPFGFGAAARVFILDAHRRGVFVRDYHIDALLDVFDHHQAWTGEELVRVAYIARAHLVDRLAILAPDDPRWQRRAAILAASGQPRAAEVIAHMLDRVSRPDNARALIRAAGHCAAYVGEQRLLRFLDAMPEVVVPVLRVKGGQQAAARLKAMVLDVFCSRDQREEALRVLMSLSPAPEALIRDLSRQLGPYDLGLLGKLALPARCRAVADIVVENDVRWRDSEFDCLEPLERLRVLCDSGAHDLVPQVVERFREVFRGYVREALAGDFTVKRLLMPELEQLLYRYGQYLVKGGRTVRRWIDDGPETGRDLVLIVACDWLGERPAPAICVALLETIARHSPSGAFSADGRAVWRHSNREIQRAAIEAILSAGVGARGLELSICKLVVDADPRIVVRALEAVQALSAHWAEPLVVAALERPEMSVKKEAARALAVIGGEWAVPALVQWLAQHDNASFRDALGAALTHAAGPATVAVLVARLEVETEPRRIHNLWQAIRGRLPMSTALRLGAVPIVPALPGKHMEFQARRGEGVGWVPATEAQRRMGFQGLAW